MLEAKFLQSLKEMVMSKVDETVEKSNHESGNERAAIHHWESGSPTGNKYDHQKPDFSNPMLVAARDNHMPVAEEYRKLKSRIIQLTKKGNANTFMVTSSISGEGKSVTSLNLAMSLAHEHECPVLLVDADLRKPSLCRYLGMKPEVGLADCLMDDMPFDDGLIKTGIGDLSLLPAGKRVINPVELFSSDKMKDLVDQLKVRYAGGFVVFDTTPVLPFAEASILGTLVDGVVFIVREGGAPLLSVAESLESLNKTNILGLVFNSATHIGGGSGYYGYQYGYHYGYRYGSDNPYYNNDTKAEQEVGTEIKPEVKRRSKLFQRFRKPKADK